MDTGSLPDLVQFECVVDGTPETPTVRVWASSTELDLTIVTSPTTSGVCNLLYTDSKLRGSDGSVVKIPQSVVFYP